MKVKSVTLSSPSGIDATSINMVLINDAAGSDQGTPITVTSPAGTKVPGGPGVEGPKLSAGTPIALAPPLTRIFLLAAKPVIKNVTLTPIVGTTKQMMSITIEIPSSIPVPGHIYTGPEQDAMRMTPADIPPVEISPIGAFSILSSTLATSNNTQYVISFQV